MKFKIIASIIVILIIVAALAIKGCSSQPRNVDENGNPIEQTQEQY